ncbi:5-(carboxyamino)imidazole ribonucleotide synthase [Schaalia sp. lx-100]|uniref:5-(carboxyamino)imidazole ribonucleotide synthase n=1 Tax=Schaalia sp. lx-100 TaxID=2899081 RepID=UPI001E655CFB|nr:5-(carboxyamino)imidazole ribonucleotide synthase [Schaalia sp. lx-100]
MDQHLCTRPVLAVIGGGQLARMMQESAIALGIDLRPLVESPDGSTGQVVVDAPVGSPTQIRDVEALIYGADALTFEHEHIGQDILTDLPEGLPIHPSASALLYAQDKIAMRKKLAHLGIPCPRWAEITTADELESFAQKVGWPLIVKTPTGGYDGHGVRLIKATHDIDDWLARGKPLLAEEKVPFIAEAAALLARRPSGEIRSWPLATTEQAHGVCSIVTAPAQGLSADLMETGIKIGRTIAEALDVTGVLAVELFVVSTDKGMKLLVNELAMRPHNSGHWTIDGSVTSQFEQHIRAVLDLPLGSTDMLRPDCVTVMANLLGSELPEPARALPEALAVDPAVRVHLYGKEVRPGRKLGHVNVVDKDPARARDLAIRAVEALAGHSDKAANSGAEKD